MSKMRIFSFLLLFIIPLAVFAAEGGESNPIDDAQKKIQSINKGTQNGDIKQNVVVKFFESIYGELDSKYSTATVMGIIGIAILGVFMLRSSPIIGLIMILAPTSVFFFIQKALDMLK